MPPIEGEKEILSVSKMKTDVEPADQSGENVNEIKEEPTEAETFEVSCWHQPYRGIIPLP